MPLELAPEIAAADALALDRIRVQTYVNDAADAKANRDKHVSEVIKHLGFVGNAHAALPAEASESTKFKRAFALNLALRYMTPVSTGDGTTDATNDAARFKTALVAGLMVLDELGLLDD